jgi:hypothetical protein
MLTCPHLDLDDFRDSNFCRFATPPDAEDSFKSGFLEAVSCASSFRQDLKHPLGRLVKKNPRFLKIMVQMSERENAVGFISRMLDRLCRRSELHLHSGTTMPEARNSAASIIFGEVATTLPTKKWRNVIARRRNTILAMFKAVGAAEDEVEAVQAVQAIETEEDGTAATPGEEDNLG